jgi:hypothetical protein
MGGEPFGDVRVCISVPLLRNDIAPALRTFRDNRASSLTGCDPSGDGGYRQRRWRVAGYFAQLDRISAGPIRHSASRAEKLYSFFRALADLPAEATELGLVSRKITQVGQQYVALQKFSALCARISTRSWPDWRMGFCCSLAMRAAVMVSPAAEKFLGAPAGQFSGPSRDGNLSGGHALRQALHLEGDELRETASETELQTVDGTKRVGVSVQAIKKMANRWERWSLCVTLIRSESINTQLQVSERLAALGKLRRVSRMKSRTRLNSMRLWLENLKESCRRIRMRRAASLCKFWTRRLIAWTLWSSAFWISRAPLR